MATRIIEYGGGPCNVGMQLVPVSQRVTAQSAMTATGTSAQSSAFAVATSIVCIQSDEAIKVSFGSSPTATDNDYKIVAGGEQFFDVRPGWKVAIKT
jgi:hypothetical protein